MQCRAVGSVAFTGDVSQISKCLMITHWSRLQPPGMSRLWPKFEVLNSLSSCYRFKLNTLYLVEKFLFAAYLQLFKRPSPLEQVMFVLRLFSPSVCLEFGFDQNSVDPSSWMTSLLTMSSYSELKMIKLTFELPSNLLSTSRCQSSRDLERT